MAPRADLDSVTPPPPHPFRSLSSSSPVCVVSTPNLLTPTILDSAVRYMSTPSDIQNLSSVYGYIIDGCYLIEKHVMN